MAFKNILTLAVLLQTTVGLRINFTNCQNPEWNCVNNVPSEIVYTCSFMLSDDVIIHLKDYYTDHITSVTVQNCKDVRVVLDCPILQRHSQLQRFKVKNCDKLQFVTLSDTSLLQTPPEFAIENVREIISLPRRMFKSPTTSNEFKCLGTTSLRKIRIADSNINTIYSEAISNVSGIKIIEFNNVTINNIQSQAIDAIMGFDNTLFSIVNSRIENLNFKGVTVKSKTVLIDNNVFGNINSNVINVTSEHLYVTGNTIKDVYSNGLILRSLNTAINNNNINTLKTNALASIKCVWKKVTRKYFDFLNNKVQVVEPFSLVFDYNSCKAAGTAVNVKQNKIDCKCWNISYLFTVNTELNNLMLNVTNNNTCLSAPCTLPIEVIKLLLESDMCQLNLDPRVVCLLYSDRKSGSENNEVTTDEDVTEPPPTFYLIRQANSHNGDASAAMTAINKDDLLRDSLKNMTNRTSIKVYFDSSRDFVETLRSTGTHRKPPDEPKIPTRDVYVNRCVGSHCRNNVAYDRQKALDFYKYVYAQLRPPGLNDSKKKKT